MADQHLYHVSVSPHIRARISTKSIMRDVMIALAPAAIFGVVYLGLRSALVIAVCIAVSVLSELVWEKCAKRPVTISDLSAHVTGLLLAMTLPPDIPLWMAAVGSTFAIIIVKQFFGGIGKNFMNPALAARCFMLIAWLSPMTSFAVQGVSMATPLSESVTQAPSMWHLFVGFVPGSIGETSKLLLILGGIYLVIRQIIDWKLPLAFIVTVFALSYAFGSNGLTAILSGGLMLGAIYMATDYTTSPMTGLGRLIFGVLCGVMTVLIREIGGYPEGVSFAIILMNILVPFIDKFTRPRAYGEVKRQ